MHGVWRGRCAMTTSRLHSELPVGRPVLSSNAIELTTPVILKLAATSRPSPVYAVQFLNTPSPPSDRHERARVDGPDVPTRATIWNRLADPGRGAVGQCGRCRRARGRPQMECPGRERQSSAANGRRDAQHDRARAAERDVADTQLRRSMSDNSSPSALPPTANIGQDHRDTKDHEGLLPNS